MFIVMLTVGQHANSQYKRERNSSFIVAVGDDLPSFQYKTLQGDELDSDFLRGQVVLIHFVASWCPFGTQQMRDIEANLWHRHNNNVNFSVVGFSEDVPVDTAKFRQIVLSDNITYPLAFDADERIYNLFATPKGIVTRTVIADANGKIVQMFDYHNKRSFRKSVKIIDKLLKKSQ